MSFFYRLLTEMCNVSVGIFRVYTPSFPKRTRSSHRPVPEVQTFPANIKETETGK